jgi:hypothetical protein
MMQISIQKYLIKYSFAFIEPRLLRNVLYFISFKEDALRKHTPLRKKDVLCVYIKSIYNKGREKKKEQSSPCKKESQKISFSSIFF